MQGKHPEMPALCSLPRCYLSGVSPEVGCIALISSGGNISTYHKDFYLSRYCWLYHWDNTEKKEIYNICWKLWAGLCTGKVKIPNDYIYQQMEKIFTILFNNRPTNLHASDFHASTNYKCTAVYTNTFNAHFC